MPPALSVHRFGCRFAARAFNRITNSVKHSLTETSVSWKFILDV